MDVRDELVRLYTTYNPKRLKDVDALLERFKGREHVILATLREKYMQSGNNGGVPAGRSLVNAASSFTNPSSFIINVPSISGGEGDVNDTARVTSIGSTVRDVQLPSSSHCVPVLKPVSSAPLTHSFSATSLSDRMPAEGHQSSDTFAAKASDRAAASTSPPPSSTTAAAAVSPLLSSYHNSSAVTYSTPTDATRLAEMDALLRQMTSLDVGQLAMRVEELARSSVSDDAAGMPRLQWRTGESNTPANSLNVSWKEVQGNVPEVLHHTSVFLKYFAECARRFVKLAQEERRFCDAKQALPTTLNGNAPQKTENDKQNMNVFNIDASFVSRPSSIHNVVSNLTTSKNNDTNDSAGVQLHPLTHSLSNKETERRTPSPPPSSERNQTTTTGAVGGESNTPSPPPTPSFSPSANHGGRSVSSTVRNIRRVHSPSPLATDDAGSPPACRTATVSPLSSPDNEDVHDTPNRRQQHKPSSPPPPPPPLEKAPKEGTLRHDPSRTNNNDRGCDYSGGLPPPPSISPQLSGVLSLIQTDHHKSKRVLHWAPSANEYNVYGPLCSTLRSGDCVVLEPGAYHENFHLDCCGSVEFTSAYPGAAVVLRPFSHLEPVLSVSGAATHVKLMGIVLVQGDLNNTNESEREQEERYSGLAHFTMDARHGDSVLGRPAVPLLSVRDGAQVTAIASHFYGGSGGGIVAAGRHTRLQLDLCLISLCSFAGVYLHGGASADITQSKVKKSEVGLRVLQGSFFVSETTFEENKSDGVVMYEESVGVLEKSNAFNNGGNGVFLSSATELRVIASTIELNALYGVQRSRGSTLHIKSSFVRDNGLLPINAELE